MSEGSGFGYPHMPTLVFAIPFSGRPLPPKLTLAFHNCTPPMNYNTIMLHTMGAPIDKARQEFAEKALEVGAKYLFFWDEDVLLPAHALRELLYVMENQPECGVIGGIYCLKSDRPEPLVFKGVGTGPYWDWKVGEVFECTALGMGCTVIRTEVFKDMPKPWFRSVDDLSPYLDNVPMGEVWTEDLFFCKKVVDGKKWKIYAHGQLLMPHIDVRTGREYELPPESKPMRALNFTNDQLKVVDIGCGPAKVKVAGSKVVGVDIRDLEGVDYRCDVRRMPFANGQFDLAFSNHVLEHFSRNETEKVLREWTRIIKPKGELRIIVPNIEWAIDKLKEGKRLTDVYNVLYGEQTYPTDFHYNGFTPKSLSEILTKVGFDGQEVKLTDYHIQMRAWRNDKRNGKKIEKRKKK